jgi:hypothetical protein
MDLLFLLLRGPTALPGACVMWITAIGKETFFREVKHFRESTGCGAYAITPYNTSFENELRYHFGTRHRGLLCLLHEPLFPKQCFWNADANLLACSETEKTVVKALRDAEGYANLLFIGLAYTTPLSREQT